MSKRPTDAIGQMRFEYQIAKTRQAETNGAESDFHWGVADGLKIASHILGFDIEAP